MQKSILISKRIKLNLKKLQKENMIKKLNTYKVMLYRLLYSNKINGITGGGFNANISIFKFNI